MSSFADVVSSFCPSKPSSGFGPAGLFVTGSEKAVPLRIRSVNSKVHCDTGFADTTETFAFISDEDVSVVFKFPLPPRSAVYKLEATIGDRTVVTEIKPKQEAQATFDHAVSQGNTAVIAKQEESSQIFTLELGNLEAMEEGIVTISYLRVLDSVGGALEWVHTSTWTPPYLGSAGDAKRGAAAAAEQNPRFAGKVAYSLAYDIQLLSSRGIKSVDSPQNISVQDEAMQAGHTSKRVTVSEEVSDPSKDLTLLVELEPLDAGKHAVATANGYGQVSLQRSTCPGSYGGKSTTKTVALATFVARPLLNTEADPTSQQNQPALNVELVLIVDCSGSMEGSRITQARDAAVYFIKDLPCGRGIKFNVVAFGSSHISWNSSCQDFSADNMKRAVEWVQTHVHANLGGTEILSTFQSVYAMPVTPGYTRQVIFLTDGGISGGEEQAVYDLVAGKKGLSEDLKSGIQRLKDKVLGNKAAEGKDIVAIKQALPAVMCLGIGHGVHRGLLDGIASRTGGVAQYVVDGESIVRKTAFLSKASLSGTSAIYVPRLVTGKGITRAVPHVLPPRLFPSEPLHVLVELDEEQPATCLKLHGKRGDGSAWELELPVPSETTVEGDAYAVLHAMCYVSALLDGTSHLHMAADGTPLTSQPSDSDIKASVVAAAVTAHLVTRHTAAVGVLVQKDPLDPSGFKKVEVPLAVPHGADHFKQQNYHLGPVAMACNFGAAPISFGAAPMRKMMASRFCAPMSSPAPPPPSGAFMGFPAPANSGGLLHSRPASAVSSAPSNSDASVWAAPAPAFGSAAASVPASADISATTVCSFNKITLAAPSAQSVPGALGGRGGSGPGLFGGVPFGSTVAAAGQPTVTLFGAVPAVDKQPMTECRKAMDPMAMDEDEEMCEASEADLHGTLSISAKPQVEKQQRTTSDVLNFLNLSRGLEGSWVDSDEVMGAVVSQVDGDDVKAKIAAARTAKPVELSGEQWATVLALAFLRRHCANDRDVWEGMESKAMAWLTQAWPQEVRPVGIVILSALKLV